VCSRSIGFALAAGVLLGGEGNPARAVGPMIVAGRFGDWAIYVIGPILGGVVAALLYDRFIAAASAPQTAVASKSGDASGSPREPATQGASGRSSPGTG